MALPHELLMELRVEGYRVWLKPPVIDEGGKKKTDLKLIVDGDAPVDRERIRDAAPLLKLLVLLEDPPSWLIRARALVDDPHSPLRLSNLAASVAYHVGGLERWQEVLDDVTAALEEESFIASKGGE